MTQTCKIAGAVVLFGMFIADIPHLSVTLVPEAQAFRGRGAAFVVGASVGSASSSAQASAAASQQQATAAQQQAAVEKEKATAAQQQAAAAQQQAAAAQQQAATPASGKLPVGTVVSTLPPGCTKKVVGDVEYRVCGENFYRAAFQGSTLVYVTAQP